MELSLGQWAGIGIFMVLILGYIRGLYYNRQLTGRVIAWLEDGLQTIGPVALEGNLPGSAGSGRLEVKRAIPPLKNVEAVYWLAPRENPFRLIFYLFLGKRDEMMVWINYQSRPGQEIEAARPSDHQLQSRLKAKDKIPLSVSNGPHGLLVASEENSDSVLAGKAETFLNHYGKEVYRLALRGNKPHLFLRVNLRIVRSASAAAFFSALRELAN